MSTYVVIDLETTGPSPDVDDKIIEIGLVVVKDNTIVDTYSTFVNPKSPIPEFVTFLTGISDADVVDAPCFSEIAEHIVQYFTDAYLVAHNVPFDMGFLNDRLKQIGMIPLNNQAIDTVELSRMLFPQAQGFKLNEITDLLNIAHDEPHRALSDAYVTAKLLIKLKKKLADLPYETLKQLLRLEHLFSSDLAGLLQGMLDQNAFKQYPAHIKTYRGLAVRQLTQPEKLASDSQSRLFSQFIDDMYFGEHTLKKQMSTYKYRKEQQAMSEYVYDAFQEGKHAVIEAQPGAGKSLAYLIPAIYKAVTEHDRVVVSTYTTQLQTQLYDDTLKTLKAATDFPFQVALLKGKQHYLSLKRFWMSLDHEEENYDIALTKAIILIWLTETTTGDVEEIQLPASGYKFFQSVSARAKRNIYSIESPMTNSYYLNAREHAKLADIVIVNHALLCADIKSDYEILPAYKYAIIDEGHHLPAIFSRTFGLKLDYLNIYHFLTFLNEIEAENKWLNNFLRKYNEIFSATNMIENWDENLERAIIEVDDLFRRLHRFVKRNHSYKTSYNDIGRLQLRIKADHLQSNEWLFIKELAQRVNMYLEKLEKKLRSLNDERLDTVDSEDLQTYADQLNTFINYFKELFIQSNLTNHVIWLEIDRGSAENIVYLHSEPMTSSNTLRENFFNKKTSIVLTSATLTVRDSFAYIQKELGLTDENSHKHLISSPFDFKEQVQLLIPDDFPAINEQSEEFIYATAEAIISLAEMTQGRMLVLFTSYHMLRKTYHLVREAINTNKYTIIAQGITSGSRSRLKRSFQTYEHALLFGTSSFWEGIDIAGDALTAVVIVRLPFKRPNDPVYEAKANQLQAHKQNPFYELALPKAVIRFKQGFGRLIRSTSDRGIVFVCDTRIMNKRYGHFFLRSIPDVQTTFASTKKLLSITEKWL